MRTVPLGLLVALLLAACSGGDGFANDEHESVSQALADSCRRSCGLGEVLDANIECEPGAALRRGALIGREEVPDEAPASSDQACVDECIASNLAKVPDHYLCAQQAQAELDCSADAVWICASDGKWRTPTFCSTTGYPWLCEETGITGGDVEPDQLTQAARRYCALLDSLESECETGTTQKHGVILGRGEDPPAEAPVSSDEVCLHVMNAEPLMHYRCKAQQVKTWDCLSSSPFLCEDGGWGTALDGCADFDQDMSLCAD